MPASRDQLTALFRSVRTHLVAGAGSMNEDSAQLRAHEWTQPYEVVLAQLWDLGEMDDEERRGVWSELKGLEREAEDGRLTLRNLPNLLTLPDSELGAVFSLSLLSLRYYLAALFRLYSDRAVPVEERRPAELWHERAEREIEECAQGWRAATLGTKRRAVEELARRYEAVRGVEPARRVVVWLNYG
ncbi:hypothetical protein JCM6882_009375 [Rhodosporidiobolus microsporus]